MGCSDASKIGALTPSVQPAITPTTATASVSVTRNVGVAQGLAASDYTWAVGIALPCTLEGASNDPIRVGEIHAGTDGEARFFPPPGTWGTRLALDCTLEASSQGHYHVDLNDSSTFKKLGSSDLAPHPTGFIRPPLTGDLSAISINDLLRSRLSTATGCRPGSRVVRQVA